MIAVVTCPRSGAEPSDYPAMLVEAGVQNNQMPEVDPHLRAVLRARSSSTFISPPSSITYP